MLRLATATLDVWRATRGGRPANASRQQSRLVDLVAFARARSPYYRARYRHLPAYVGNVHDLPPTTKPELMAHFDAWATDPAVNRAGVEAFAADLSKVGEPYLGRYLVWTTSGTTGEPALLVHDRRALMVYTALAIRTYLTWLRVRDLWELLRRGGRAAALLTSNNSTDSRPAAPAGRSTAPRRSCLASDVCRCSRTQHS